MQTHHFYRSGFIIDMLYAIGFCSSYGEVQQFEKKAADCVAPDMLLGEDIDVVDTTQLFAGDNVDHNILTIDGKGKFHGMGWADSRLDTRTQYKTYRTLSRRLKLRLYSFTLPIM